MLNDVMNNAAGGVAVICTDPPRHDEMRRLLRRPLMMDALRDLAPQLRREAAALVDRLVAQGTFDAVSDLAQHLPVSIISNLVGIRGRTRADAGLGHRIVRRYGTDERSHRGRYAPYA